MKRAKILIVEDEKIIAKDLESILTAYEYVVTGIAANAFEAEEMANKSKPDLILMDIVLKDNSDGIEAAKIIKDKLSLPIIFLTAYSDDKTLNRVKAIEPSGYLLKPFEERELYTCIEVALYKHVLENKLKENEKLVSAILNNIGEGVISTDTNGLIKFMNPYAEKLTGIPEKQAIGKPINQIVKIVSDSGEVLGDFLSNYTNTGIDLLAYSIETKTGSKIHINFTASPITDDKNHQTGTILILKDMTEFYKARRAEIENETHLKNLAEKLAKSNKDLEQFAYIASHDLQEPLRMVASYVQLLQKKYRDKLSDEANEFIGFAVDGVSRMKALINDLLMYSRVNTQSEPYQQIDCNELIKEVISNLNKSVNISNANIKIENLPVIAGNATQISQLFYNLLSNSLKFHKDNKPDIAVSSEKISNNWRFSFKDNGIGIDQQYSDKVFVMFQRLHNYKDYPGTGIGLAICKKIIENHEGKIWFDSTPGEGSTFYFQLPIIN